MPFLNAVGVVFLAAGFLATGCLALWLFFLYRLAIIAERVRRNPEVFDSNPSARLAVLIPAHNEEKMIGTTVSSVLENDYPQELLSVLVVADNCEDATAAEAEKAGAEVLVRFDSGRRGKGFALQDGLAHLAEKDFEYQAVVFFDADTLVDRGFLKRAAGALAAGRPILQGHNRIADPDRTWFTRLTSLGFILKHRFQYPGLERIGLSAPLRGASMCLSREILDRFGWGSVSLTEDLDFTISLVEAGYQVFFDYEASTLTYMPPTPDSARTQRERWSAGGAASWRARLKRNLVSSLLKRDFTRTMQALFFAFPPLSLLLAAGAGTTAMGWLLYALGLDAALWLGLSAAAVTAGYCFYFMLSLAETGVSARYLAALLMIPVFAVWRTLLHFRVVWKRKKERSWDRTPRV